MSQSTLKHILGVAIAGGLIAACASAPAAAEVRTAQVTRGAVTQTVSVSGSVSSAGTVKLNPATNGKVAQLLVTVGQQVSAGQPLAKLDTTDLETALAQAEASLASAQLNYDKARSSAGDAQSSLAATQRSTANDIASAQQALAKLKANYAAARNNFLTLIQGMQSDISTFRTGVTTASTQLQQAQSDLLQGYQTPDNRTAQNAVNQAQAPMTNATNYCNGILASAYDDFSGAWSNLLNAMNVFDAVMLANSDTASASQSYQQAQVAYSLSLGRLLSALDVPNGQLASVQSSVTTAQNALSTTATKNDTSQDAARADLIALQTTLTAEGQLVTSAKNKSTQAGSALATIGDAIGGSYVSAIQNVAATIERSNQSIQNAQTAVNGQPYNIQTALNSLQSQQNTVQTAQTNLDNATITAPVSGVVTTISAQVGENVTSGSATGFIVLANTGSMALHGTVGEADIVKLKLGQVATVTVDAVGTAKMTGKVTSLDPVATIASGVPVYGIDVTVDLPSPAVRPGMSGTAQVILASSPNTLTVPNLAVKTLSGRRYLTVMKDGQQVDTDVTFGIANDTVTEVLSGVQEGDVVVLPQPRAAASGAGGVNRGVQIGGGGGPGR